MISGMLRPLENLPVGRCEGQSIPYGGASALAVVTRQLLLPLSTKESPKTKNALASALEQKFPSTAKMRRKAPQILAIFFQKESKSRKIDASYFLLSQVFFFGVIFFFSLSLILGWKMVEGLVVIYMHEFSTNGLVQLVVKGQEFQVKNIMVMSQQLQYIKFDSCLGEIFMCFLQVKRQPAFKF